jgi:exopolysaccharide biosynthesis polyprenyl glycosylphosphotransferase
MGETTVDAWGALEAPPLGPLGRTLPGPLADAPKGGEDTTILARETTFRRLLAAADVIAATMTVLAGVVLAAGQRPTWLALSAPALLVFGCKAAGLYDRDENLLHKTTLDEVPKLFTVATLGALLLYLAEGGLVTGELGRADVAVAWATLALSLPALRALARVLARHRSPGERCLFVGNADSAEAFREKLAGSSAVNAELVGWIPPDGPAAGEGTGRASLPERIRSLIVARGVHRIVLGPGASGSDELVDALRRIKGHAVKVSVLPDVARVVDSSAELDRLNGITLLGVRRFEISSSSRVIKRAFDVLASSLALIVAAPLLCLAAVAIKLDSRGPVFFRQWRAGRHGEPFEMVKLRTMVDGAEHIKDELLELNEAADGLFKISDDPRVTRVGAILRRTHIDELPQMLNVVRGDMSLVGPRPLVLEEDRRIEGWHRRRLDIRPGITGPWQALGASRIPVHEMVRLDYRYVADWSLWNDIRILLLTAAVVLRRQGL